MDKDTSKAALAQIADAVRALGYDGATGRVQLPISDALLAAVLAAGGRGEVSVYARAGGVTAIPSARIVVDGVEIDVSGRQRPATTEETALLASGGSPPIGPTYTAAVTL